MSGVRGPMPVAFVILLAAACGAAGGGGAPAAGVAGHSAFWLDPI